MAQRTEVVWIDDVDGSVAETTILFALDGVPYSIDLSATNAAALRADFAKWIDNARKVRRASTGARRGAATTSAGVDDVPAIRAWAAANGIEVSPRGRIPAKVREAYLAAQ